MARDGLMPRRIASVNPRTGTPVGLTLLLGLLIAIIAALVPLAEIVELVNIGTLFAFLLVNIGVIILRRTQPDMERPFRVPFVPLFPIITARGGARRRISPGSTGERLLHGATCPVAVAPRGMRDEPADRPVQRVGVAFVDTPEAKEALQVASSLAERTGAGLRLFTVVAPRAEVFAPVTGRNAEEAFLATLRDNEQAALDDREIDLLACGSRGYGPVRRVLLGGVSSRLMRRAACPVVVVPRCSE